MAPDFFFGIRARGQFFVYVVDCSGSMIDDDRMPRATIELRRSVFGLREPQRFEVIFYNHESIPMPGGPIPRPADQQSKEQLRSFLRLVDPDGGTDPRLAVKQALSLRPDAVFLLSDGAFPDGAVDEHHPKQQAKDPGPLYRSCRRPCRRPSQTYRPGQQWPVRLADGRPSWAAMMVLPARLRGLRGSFASDQEPGYRTLPSNAVTASSFAAPRRARIPIGVRTSPAFIGCKSTCSARPRGARWGRTATSIWRIGCLGARHRTYHVGRTRGMIIIGVLFRHHEPEARIETLSRSTCNCPAQLAATGDVVPNPVQAR